MANRDGDVIWSEAIIARLRALHAAGTSFTTIAETLSEEFHVKLSKSATIGKAHRLKLTQRPHVIRDRRKPSPPPEPEPDHAPVAVLPWKVSVPEALPVTGVRITIWQLRRGVCHYPFGDRPPYAYCGITTPRKATYCAYHQRVMYGPRRAA